MMKIFQSAVVIASFTGLIACSASTPTQAPLAPVAQPLAVDDRCMFPDAFGTPAPKWVCNEKDERLVGDGIYAVGFAKPSRAGYSHMTAKATLKAQTALTKKLSVLVTSMVTDVMNTTGLDSNLTVDTAMNNAEEAISKADLSGASIVQSRTSPKGGLYVLMVMKKARFDKISEDIVGGSLGNMDARHQQFQAEKTLNEMRNRSNQ